MERDDVNGGHFIHNFLYNDREHTLLSIFSRELLQFSIHI